MSKFLTCPLGHQWEEARARSCPVCGAAATTVALEGGVQPAVPRSITHPHTPPPAEGIGPPTVPGYEIVRELGRGGMGVVYLARQSGLNRLVALKMVLAGAHAGSTDLHRFRKEAEAVARLAHPHIVQIHEIGEQNGVPWFSLEYVEGGSLAQRLAGQPQPPRAAAETVETLARAMEHAHRHGLVHRDLKPGNVLLTGAGVPKVTDFGLVKDLDTNQSDTRSGTILGTPSYIAPEQAAGKRDVGPAADVYALGAILYEMLTGRPPFQGETAMDTMLQVLSVEPVAPRRLQPKVPIDLETICLKCLEKNATKRYPSAAALADDLQRFRSGTAILARPAGRRERLGRWARRNPAVAALTVALLLALAGGFISITVLWRQAEGAYQRAEQLRAEAERNYHEAEEQRRAADRNLAESRRQRDRADKHAQQARQVVDQFLTQVADNAIIQRTPGLQRLRKDLLQAALKYYQDFAREARGDPALQGDLALAYLRVAIIQTHAGSKAEALTAVQESLALYRPLVEQRPEDHGLRRHFAYACSTAALLHHQTGQIAAGVRALAEAHVQYERLARAQPGDQSAQSEWMLSWAMLGNYQAAAGRIADGLASLRQGQGLGEKLAAAQPGNRAVLHNLARTRYALGFLLYETGQYEEARAGMLRARLLYGQALKADPDNLDLSLESAICANGLGQLARATGQPAEALTFFKEARECCTRLVHDNPDVHYSRQELARVLYQLALLHHGTSPAEAAAALAEARKQIEWSVQNDPTDHAPLLELGRILFWTGRLQREAGQPAEALKTVLQARQRLEQLTQAMPEYLDGQSELGAAFDELGQVQEALGRRDEALASYYQARERQRTAFAKAPEVVAYRRYLGGHCQRLAKVQRDLGRIDEAAATALERQKLAPADPAPLYDVARDLALTAAAVGKGKPVLTAEEQARRERIAAQALAALRDAVKHGYRDAAQLQREPDLALLRERPEFQELVRQAAK